MAMELMTLATSVRELFCIAILQHVEALTIAYEMRRLRKRDVLEGLLLMC